MVSVINLAPNHFLSSSSSTAVETKTSSASVVEETSTRVVRRHERTYSQATNILEDIASESEDKQKNISSHAEESMMVIEDKVKPYSERKQFWETVSSSPESKRSSLIKSETESDTDTGTEGTVIEKRAKKQHIENFESNESRTEIIDKVSATFYENAGFMGSKNIDDVNVEESHRCPSPYEVRRSDVHVEELPSPEDVSLKDVKTKREIFEQEIKRQSLEYEESIGRKSLKQSSTDDSSSESKDLPPDDSKQSSSKKLIDNKEKEGELLDSMLKATGSEMPTKLQTIPMFDKASSLSTSSEKSDSFTGSIDRSSDIFSSSIDKSSSRPNSSSSEFRSSTIASSSVEADGSEDDMTRTEESSEDETTTTTTAAGECGTSDERRAPKVKLTEERRVQGNLEEFVIRETTTTRAGGQEQRVIKETKTQETHLADGSKVKSTSITTFTTQLDTHSDEDETDPNKKLSRAESQERQQSVIEQRVKSDIFKEEICFPSDNLSPEHKILSPKEEDTLLVYQKNYVPSLSSPIHVPEENIQEIVWEVSQERSEIPESETVEDIPDQDLSERILEIEDEDIDTQFDSTAKTVIKLSEEDARKIALEIVEQVKSEAFKRSPNATPSKDASIVKRSSVLLSDSAESSFSEETTQQIDKFIQEQLGSQIDDDHRALIESVASRKKEILQQKLSAYQQSVEITDEDLRSSGAELSPIEHHMERLRQMTEDDDTLRSVKEPSEADESEGSMIIHESLDDPISNQYDQATQMISKTLDTIQSVNLKSERIISTISEEASETESKIIDIIDENAEAMSHETNGFHSKFDELETDAFSYKDVKVTGANRKSDFSHEQKLENAIETVRDTKSMMKEDVRMEYNLLDQMSPDLNKKLPITDSVSKLNEVPLECTFTTAYTKEKISQDTIRDISSQEKSEFKEGSVVFHQRSLELHKEQHMESSMTESMEESSTAESARHYDSKMISEANKSVITEIKEIDETVVDKFPEVTMRDQKVLSDDSKKVTVLEGDTASSSGDSHYFTAEGGTSDSHTGSRPCSSDVEALLSGTTGTTGTSEYETALSSQDNSRRSHYSSTSAEYRTAGTSISSHDSMKSIDSESSGHLGSIELSEASATLVPSSLELERDMEALDQEIFQEELRRSQNSQQIIPELTFQSETPKTEDSPSCFDIDSDELDESEMKEEVDGISHIPSKMKRSVEMTFHPDPQPLCSTIEEDSNTAIITDVAFPTTDQSSQITKSLEESTISNTSAVTVIESGIVEVSDQTLISFQEQSSSQIKEETKVSVSTASQNQENLSGIMERESVHSVTITATSVPSTEGKATASMCTQVTSQIRTEEENKSMKSGSVFQIEGPTEVDEVAEKEKVTESRPVVAPDAAFSAVLGASAGPPEGPVRDHENFDAEADQDYHKLYTQSTEESADAELQYSIDDDDDDDDENNFGMEVTEPHDRPRTPEPGYEPPQKSVLMSITSSEDPDDLTEVDQRFSAVFSMTYEDSENGTDTCVPNITITEHMAPMKQQYPDLEKEENFPECRGSSIASSQSSVTSPKSTTSDSDQGREYCLDSQKKDIGSFEMVEFEDIGDLLEFEQTMVLHDERVRDIAQIKEEDEDEEMFIENGHRSSPPTEIPHTIKAVKLDQASHTSSELQSLENEDNLEQYESTIEEQRRWLEMQFEQGSETASDEFSPPKFIDHVYSGPLEDIEEEREDLERRDLSHVTKGTSLSSTPEYDVLAGKKFFTRSGEHDDLSMCSLQEFERLEREMALENAARRSSSGSQESLNGKRPFSKSSQGDDVSVASLNSLNEFENLEKQCAFVEQIEKKAQEEAAMLSEIEEGHESQVSEAESCETISDDDDDNYADRMFQIDEIIRQAQDNVEKFEGISTANYQGVRLKDIVSVDGSTVSSDKSPSVGMPDDPDSLEEPVKLGHPSDSSSVNIKFTSQDSLDKSKTHDRMTTSADSLELCSKDPMKTSVDSLEFRKKRDMMTVSTDSIDPTRHDVMVASIDSLGKDDSSGREGDISSASEMVPRPNGTGMMEWSTDSLEPSSSLATHATYHDNDSFMSSSFASGCSNTLIGSMEECGDLMAASMYIPEGVLPPENVQEQYSRLITSGEAITSEVIAPCTEAGFSHTITRSVTLPPQIREVKFTGSDAQQKMEEYMKEFNEGEHTTEEENVDDKGNVYIQRIVHRRLVVAPEETNELGFTLSDPSTEETVTTDQYGNITRIIKRTVVSSHTVQINPDTGKPVQQSEEDSIPALMTQAQLTSAAASGSVINADDDFTASSDGKPLPVTSKVSTCELTTEAVATSAIKHLDGSSSSGEIIKEPIIDTGLPGTRPFFRPVPSTHSSTLLLFTYFIIIYYF